MCTSVDRYDRGSVKTEILPVQDLSVEVAVSTNGGVECKGAAEVGLLGVKGS